MMIFAKIAFHERTEEMYHQLIPLEALRGECVVKHNRTSCLVEYEQSSIFGDVTKTDIQLKLTVLEGAASNLSIGLVVEFDNWSKENYVLVPGAIYNGNRFAVYPVHYPPIRADAENFGPDALPMITDIPRLEGENGKFQLHAGDMTTPAFGFHDKEASSGFLLQTVQGERPYETGMVFEENAAASQAKLTVSIPGIKQKTTYRMGGGAGITTKYPSSDEGAVLAEGAQLVLKTRLYSFECSRTQTLFDVFYDVRQELTPEQRYDLQLPFSECWNILENTFNREKWVEHFGYFSMGGRPGYDKAWILGWPGMMMYPMLMKGSAETKRRAIRNIEYITRCTQAPTGFFYASAGGAECFGDNFKDRNLKNWNLIRRNADGLYYLVKCLFWMKTEDKSVVSGEVEAAVLRCADAFVLLWERYGQIGQFIDVETGEIIIGGTASGALSAGALALCAHYFDKPVFGETAEKIAEHYYRKYVSEGITNGGPGEILQAPDSESSYAMVESFVTLYEMTGKAIWLQRSEEMARQFATWCMSYNYRYPELSEFARLEMKSIGSVFANVQNKHSAPGICTHSGIGLLKLFRYTSNVSYLKLLKEIAGSIPQYLSREGRQMMTLAGKPQPTGWMHERVQTSDWEGEDRIGEVPYANCWCSVALMMTSAEVPGVYIQTDTGFICAIDHIEANLLEQRDGEVAVEFYNPTDYDAEITVLIERSGQIDRMAGENIVSRYRMAACPAKSRVVYRYKDLYNDRFYGGGLE